MVKVIQADRDAAAPFEGAMSGFFFGPASAIDVLRLAFARHRTAAQPEREAVSTRPATDLDGLREPKERFLTPADVIAALTTPAPASERGDGVTDGERSRAVKIGRRLDAEEAAPAVSRDEIVAVLEPFAKAAAAYLKPEQVVQETPSNEWPNYYITARDLHAARAILSRLRGSGE